MFFLFIPLFHTSILLLERYCFHLHCSESDWNGSCMEIMGCCSIHALLSPFTVLFYYSLPPPIHRIFSQCIAELQPKSCVFRENLMHLYFVFCKWWNELKCKCKDAHVMVRFSKKQEFINFLLKDSKTFCTPPTNLGYISPFPSGARGLWCRQRRLKCGGGVAKVLRKLISV